jgi:hypothetical protein
VFAIITYGSHEAAVMQQQICASQLTVGSAFGAFHVPHITNTPRHHHEYGTHEAAILQAQILSGSTIFRPVAVLPRVPLLGLARAFAISQEEQPLDSPSTIFVRTLYLSSAGTTNPVVRQVLSNAPQWPQDVELLGNRVWRPALPGAGPTFIPPRPRYLTSTEESPMIWQANPSQLFEPIPTASAATPSYAAPHLELEEVASASGEWSGEVILNWIGDPSLLVFEVYVYILQPPQPQPGVLQQPPQFVNGLRAQATGLQLDTTYTFAVVGIAAGQTATPVSNYIEYRHAASAEFGTVTKYPWGDTFKTGYVLVVPLGTKV